MVTVPVAPSVALLRFHEPLDPGLSEVLRLRRSALRGLIL